jgi:hypothetical protein
MSNSKHITHLEKAIDDLTAREAHAVALYEATLREVQALQAELQESRQNDRTAMRYLWEIRQAMQHAGDFPSLVDAIKQMCKAKGHDGLH